MTDKKPTRSESVRIGVQALHHLLGQVITTPHAFMSDEELIAALNTQGGLAQLDRAVNTTGGETLNTFPTSLNTLKKYSDEVLTGGFNTLNALRVKAIEAIERHEQKKTKSNKRTREGLKLTVAEHEQELDMLRQTNFLLLRALQESMGQIKNISSSNDPLLREKWGADAIATLLAITSLCIPPFNLTELPAQQKNITSTVTDINDYRT
ncbi:hypothetical protein [Pseudomonas viridiflava]|uniref:hypothetical protein n=1 Tax=Pseudomonas viridiflava TaxID=33069 RepID=UPI000F043ED4|nr:hypothetical protein [Pseudomonas viridiflava]